MSSILVIDDELNMREMLSEAFTFQGHHVTTAADGQEGLDIVRRTVPDLVLLDLMMPEVDGYQVLDALQKDEKLRTIPVIILTALNHRNQIVEGLQRGANDYITKPFNLQELLARVDVQLRILDLERELRYSEAYHRALFERASDPELLLGETGNILRANRAAMHLLGMDQDRLVSTRLHNLVSPADRPEFEVAFSGAFEGSDIPIFEIHLTASDGKLFPVDADLCPVDMEDRRHMLLHLRDIRRRKAAETRTLMIFEYIGDGLFITDSEGVVLLASRSVESLTGYTRDETVGVDVDRFHSGAHASGWRDRLQEDRAVVYEDVLRKKDGQEIPVEWTAATFSVGSETYFIGVARDLSDRKASEERRMESERLKTLLEIAGGAAHEINQPLTAILGYAEMSLEALEQDHPSHAYQRHIVDAALRISQTLKQMQEIRKYRTRPYANGHQIVDFERSSKEEEGEAADES